MTPLQRRNFQLYVQYRGRRMTIAGLLWANRHIYLLLFLVFGAFAAAIDFALGPSAAKSVGVAFAVLVLRDIGFYRRSVMLWPALEQVLDWSLVERMITFPDTSDPHPF